jgi:hypothetical protein
MLKCNTSQHFVALLHFLYLASNLYYVSGSSSFNKSKAIASIEGVDFVFFSGANWSEGEVTKYGVFWYLCMILFHPVAINVRITVFRHRLLCNLISDILEELAACIFCCVDRSRVLFQNVSASV